MSSKLLIGVIGLGYVGLPLSVELGKKYKTIGYDINKERINNLRNKIDYTNEISSKELKKSKNLNFTNSLKEISKCNFFIIAVPTPINFSKKPDLRMLKKASENIGKILKKNDIVVYESTVYPGLTEEFCVPILEKKSKLKINLDFSVGYSPERINPGDKKNTLTNIKKIISASNSKALKKIDSVYKGIIRAGVYKTSSIKVAEAAKVIENAQRDINVAFVNELSIIFNKLGIDTKEVIDAAKTKWNFQPFYPGIVGGHCIGVDPYYLAHKAEIAGYQSKIILAGRKLNDGMGKYIGSSVLKMVKKKMGSRTKKRSKIAILGLAFKENCSDIRNSRVVDIKDYFENKKISCDIYDPLVNTQDVYDQYRFKVKPLKYIYKYKYDAIIIAVKHKIFKNIKFNKITNKDCIIYDVKSFYDKKLTSARL